MDGGMMKTRIVDFDLVDSGGLRCLRAFGIEYGTGADQASYDDRAKVSKVLNTDDSSE